MPKGKGKGKRSSVSHNGNGVSHTNGSGANGDSKRPKHENGNGTSKHSNVFKLNPALNDLAGKLNKSWATEALETESVNLMKEPFTCCTINNFVDTSNGRGTIDNLIQELDDLEFKEKSNDLYKFRQSGDLKAARSSACIRGFRDLMENNVKNWLHRATGIDFDDSVDMFCARYDYTDYLSCHDDELEGRRIAYIWYLVPTSWNKTDGGALDLFNTDDAGHPGSVVKSIVPSFNSFAFFEVTPKSFHQVAEVLTRDKTRLSISGWFHGTSAPWPKRMTMPAKIREKPADIDEDDFFEWINPLYLDPVTQSEIQENFEHSSEISLSGFFADDKHAELSAALRDSGLQWGTKGPANKRCYDNLEDADTPEIVKKCVQLLKSDAMFLLLSNMTGLRLHQLAPVSDSEKDDDDDKEVEESDEKKERKEKSPTASSSKMREVQEEDDDNEDDDEKRTKKGSKDECDPECSVEVRRWRRGCYTMLTDGDAEAAQFALDARLFVNCGGWSLDCGGFSSYIAKDEDEELLTAQPEENALILAYRDADTLRFVKRVTDEVNHKLEGGEFHDVSLVYYE
jgi:Rps23 Pro-64 3,4-dihydroxylase Tpa1-like proline 4-hydroxylase